MSEATMFVRVTRKGAAPRALRAAPLAASVVTSGLSVAVAGLVAMSVSWFIISSGPGVAWAGVASFAIQLPVALGLAAGGMLADRHGSRAVLLASDLATLGAVALAAFVATVPSVPLATTVALLALGNLVGAPGNVAQDARVPEMARLAGVPLERANGLRDIAFNLGQAGGPALGVVLVAAGGLPLALWAAAGVLALVAALDAALFPRFLARRSASSGSPLEGFRSLRADPVLLSVIGLGVGLIAVFASLDEIVAPSLAVAGGLPDGRLALFLAMNGVAALVGGLLFTAYGHRLPRRAVFVGGIAAAAAGFVALAALPTGLAFAVAPVLIGLGVGPLSPLVTTVLQRRAPAAVRASILGAFSASILVVQPFAALGAAPAVAALGVGTVTWALAATAIAATLTAALLPALRGLQATRGGASSR